MDAYAHHLAIITLAHCLMMIIATAIWMFLARDHQFETVVAVHAAVDKKFGLTPKANPGEVMHQVHGQKKPVRQALPINQALLVRKTPAWIDNHKEPKSWK